MGKALLNQYLVDNKLSLPEYVVVKTEGLVHSPIFTVVCSADGVDGGKVTATDSAYTKQIAENKAALKLFEYMNETHASVHLTCPKCSKDFWDGYYHQARSKLYSHMSNGAAHIDARNNMTGAFEGKDRLIHEIRNR